MTIWLKARNKKFNSIPIFVARCQVKLIFIFPPTGNLAQSQVVTSLRTGIRTHAFAARSRPQPQFWSVFIMTQFGLFYKRFGSGWSCHMGSYCVLIRWIVGIKAGFCLRAPGVNREPCRLCTWNQQQKSHHIPGLSTFMITTGFISTSTLTFHGMYTIWIEFRMHSLYNLQYYIRVNRTANSTLGNNYFLTFLLDTSCGSKL